MKEKHVPNFEEPMQGMTLLQPEQCKICIYRNKTTIAIDGKSREVGWDKDTGGAYTYPEWKPNPVMKNKAACPRYEKNSKIRKHREL